MKVKLTPLNIVSALSIMAVVGLVVNKNWLLAPANQGFKGLFIALGLLVFFVSFLCDQIFRKFIPTLARLWLMQLMVVILAVVFVLVLKISVFG
ncbi:hypothetical protein [Pedobacter sp. SL55]|uniref:hypothetical protein n=1 Tax=Pedobacter sp. SL55 TaxID=2995161 RepID=UPI00226FB8E0|nr:hypothetical protein [Pedobacter sp. SL55]WAC40656.1 hypothetical protein OVA16_19135 [Pedobacter sp. SL55]